ncbi:MAG TPA: ABC transporter permease subunit [Thermoanaerobaculia bacterium]|nr:ABC transporter permease subunit [Thermoanaerobaculia bacterium]
MRRRLALLPLAALLFALLVWPFVHLAVESVLPRGGILDAGGGPGGHRPGFSLANYGQIVRDPLYRGEAIHSLVLSVAVAAASIVLCLAPAWVLVRREFFGKRLLRALLTLPMSFSGIIVGFLGVIMLGRIGFVPRLLERLTGRDYLAGAAYQLTGLVIAYVYFEIPRATLALESSLRKFDFRLLAASATLGAGRWQRLRYVLLPGLWPALLSTFAVTFCVSMGSFGVALILAKRFSVLPLEIYQQLTGFLNSGLAAAMGVALVAVSFTVNYGLRAVAERRRGADG